jgi:hypothetical protein
MPHIWGAAATGLPHPFGPHPELLATVCTADEQATARGAKPNTTTLRMSFRIFILVVITFLLDTGAYWFLYGAFGAEGNYLYNRTGQ